MALRTLYFWTFAVMYQKDILDMKVPVNKLVHASLQDKLVK